MVVLLKFDVVPNRKKQNLKFLIMKKAITLFFVFATFGGVAMAQSPQLSDAPISGTSTINSQIEDRIATEVQNLDARINMNSSQESAVTTIFRSAVSDIRTTKERMKGNKDAFMAYKEQRIEQAIDELEQHLTPTQFQQAKDYAQQRGFNF